MMNHIIFYYRTLRTGLGAIFLAGALLLFSPLSAMAQTIEWSPESMFFQDTLVDTTAYMTLTLTAADAPVTISSVEWTYNQIGEISFTPQYDYILDRPVPAVLLPGESMDIDILFTPEVALTFASANLLVTNSSLNAGSLNYWIDGIGSDTNVCTPLVDCDGACTDTANDLNNCGACGNVCEATANSTAVCENYTCGFVCNDGYEPVGNLCVPINNCSPLADCDGICVDIASDLNNCGACGNVCEATANSTAVCESYACSFTCNEGYEPAGNVCLPIMADPTLEEMMLDLLVFYHQSMNDGTLVGFGPGASAKNRILVVLNWLYEANSNINNINHDTGEPEPELVKACLNLNDAHLRSDGGYPFRLPPDFIAGEATNEVHSKILDIIDEIEGCEAAVAATRPVK